MLPALPYEIKPRKKPINGKTISKENSISNNSTCQKPYRTTSCTLLHTTKTLYAPLLI